MRLMCVLFGIVVWLGTQPAIAGSLKIMVDSTQWLPKNLQDSLQIKLGQYIQDFPVDILVAVLADSTKESALKRIDSLSKGKNFMTVLVLPKTKDALIIPHPAIKDTNRLKQVQEQVLRPIVFAGGYYYGIYSALLLLGQTPPEVDTTAINERASISADSLDGNSIKPPSPRPDIDSILSPRNISRAIAILVTILVAYLSWRRWREYKSKEKGESTTE